MGKIKKFFADFKAFISKGSILDLAVGVVIGSAFTAIINALVKSVLMPIITAAVPGGLDGLVTVLNHNKAVLCASDNAAAVAAIPASTTTVTYWGYVYDSSLVNVINWGAVINAAVNFIIIAFLMFLIVKAAMMFQTSADQLKARANAFTPEERKALRKEGHSIKEINKLADDKVQKEKDDKAKADAEAKAKEVTEITLLTDIKGLLADKAEKKD